MHRALENLYELGWQIGPDIAKPVALSLPVRSLRGRQVVGGNRIRPGHDVIEEHTERVDIALWRRFRSIELLRRDVEWRADDPGLHSRSGFYARAEIHQNDA